MTSSSAASVDYSRRFTLENLDISGQVVRLSGVWQRLLRERHYPKAVLSYLGEMACVAVMVGAGMKHPGRATLQIQQGRKVRLAVCDCTHELGLRAMVTVDDDEAPHQFADWVEGATLALTLTHDDTHQQYQSIVPVSGLSVAECFEHYFDQSEQLPTQLWLAANAEGAGALLLQKLPGADQKDADGWARVEQLAASVTDDELIGLDAENLLTRLFHQETVRLHDPRTVFANCRRDETKVRNMLRSLGREELNATLAEHGAVIVHDDMTNEEYRFDHADIAALFDNNGEEA